MRSIAEIATNLLVMGRSSKSWFITLFVLIGLITLNSCGEEQKSPEEELKGKWLVTSFDLSTKNYTDDSTQYSISLNYGENEVTFSTNAFPAGEMVKGTWKVSADTIWFSYDNLQRDAHASIDSVELTTDSTGSPKMFFYSTSKEQASVGQDGLKLAQKKHYATVLSHTDKELVLQLDQVGTFHLAREEVHQGGFSLMSILRGMLGMIFLIAIAWVFSMDRKAIDWKLVGMGVGLQLVIALLVLKFPLVEAGFDYVSQAFVTLIGYTDYGINFLFKQMGTDEVQGPLLTFAIKVLPTIIFFSALMSLLYYWGILQKVVYAFAWLMKKFMNLSGAESLAAAGNVFLGQTESPLLVKPFLSKMTRSELMCLMTGGMATIAGGVLAAYIGFLGGDDPAERAFFAKHLLTASIISAPAAIVAAKILVPETEKINQRLEISKDKIGVNALEAITNGTTDGLKLAVNVGAMLLVFIAMMALANGLLGWVGSFGGINDWIASNTSYKELSFQFLLGYACSPIVWMMGVDWVDCVNVGELLGQKTILNEFVAYPRLGEMKNAGMLNEKSIIMSTYMLCGFANIASIGIQIGGIGALVPSRKGLLSQLGVRALIGGTIACLLTAVVVGMTM
ncbi:NupC/NupG family nucleoside CNT transporter [Parvicella tangerina]|nr:nucleoside transporter C-terminal domain-containing protein [Parvicella tangerina]